MYNYVYHSETAASASIKATFNKYAAEITLKFVSLFVTKKDETH